jgi:hypothetical protein
MELLIIAGLVLLVALLVLVQRGRRPAAPPARKAKSGKPRAMDALDTVAAWPPQATRVLTVGERKAWGVLHAALPDHMILAQVPLSRFMKVPTRNSYSEWLRRAGLMSADIVVCDTSSQVIAVVDIRAEDGKETARARQRHARMDRVIAAANIPMHVWYEHAIPSPSAARDLILAPAATAGGSTSDAPAVPRLSDPIEADVLLEAEFEQRDPPPSTWFDNLDSAAVPLGNVPTPRASGSPSPRKA